MGEYYSPSDTRPLSIVNTDNRIIASAMRLTWEPIFNNWVSKVQRGFLKGRSMLANIIDIDEASMTVSLTERYGGLILFDFKAAVPSLNHDYLINCLERLGIPDFVLNAVKTLYSQVRCVLRVKGADHGEIDMEAGVRQGCPLSPLLFAVTVDLLLRRLTRLFPDATFRAFADDIGAVFKNIVGDARMIMEVFKQFGAASGLDLNFPKTVVIPLWDELEPNAKQEMTAKDSSWSGVEFREVATYLGFVIGPGKGDSSWDKACRKYFQRVWLWSAQKQGLHISIYAYNTLAISVLSFLAQLEEPPTEVLDTELMMLRKRRVVLATGCRQRTFGTLMKVMVSTSRLFQLRCFPKPPSSVSFFRESGQSMGLR